MSNTDRPAVCLDCTFYHPERRTRRCSVLRDALPPSPDRCAAKIQGVEEEMRRRQRNAWKDTETQPGSE